MLRRTSCAEMLDGGIMVEDMHLETRVHFMIKAYYTQNLSHHLKARNVALKSL